MTLSPVVDNADSLTLLDRIRCCLPGYCILCHFPLRRAISLCNDCEAILPVIQKFCGVCGVAQSAANDTGLCGRCLIKVPPYTLCRGVLHYRSPVDALIAAFKYRGDFASGRVLGWQLAQRFENYYQTAQALCGNDQSPQLLIPVPLHHRRLRERGFNQAVLLARMISERTGIPVAGRLLERTRYTAPQSQLPAHKRATNLSHAISMSGREATTPWRHVAVIDDVVTTTATAVATTRTLNAAGVARVDIWAVARA